LQRRLPDTIIVQGNDLFIPTLYGLRIVNISDPQNPFLEGSYRSRFPESFTVAGQRIYLYSAIHLNCSDSTQDNILSKGLEEVDVGNPEYPHFYPLTSIRSIQVSGSYAYLAVSEEGLIILDVTNPGNPVLVGSYHLPSIRDVFVSGSYAYATNYIYVDSELRIIDVRNPVRPTLVGKFNNPGKDAAVSVSVVGTYAYLVGGAAHMSYQYPFSIIDVSNPRAPFLGGTVGRNYEECSSVCVQGDYAFIKDWNNAESQYTLGIYDVSDKSNPVKITAYSPTIECISFTVSGTYAYIADGISKLEIIDTSNPSQPLLINAYDFSILTSSE